MARTRHDTQLYDESLGTRVCQTCWTDEPEYIMPSYDAAIYDLTLHDAVTVLPSFEPFDDPLKNVLPSSPPLPDSSTQEELSFEKYYGVTQAEAWPVFDQLDPLEWFQQEKALADANYLTLQSQQVIKRAKESAIAIQYKLPFAMIARTALPNAKDMHGVYLTGAIHKNDTPIVLDTGASISITPYRSDFIGDLEECDVELHGLSDTVKVEGIGWVEWSIQDSFGQVTKIRTHAYLVPAGNIRCSVPKPTPNNMLTSRLYRPPNAPSTRIG